MTLELASTGDEDGGDHMPVDMVTAGLVVYFGQKGRPGMSVTPSCSLITRDHSIHISK